VANGDGLASQLGAIQLDEILVKPPPETTAPAEFPDRIAQAAAFAPNIPITTAGPPGIGQLTKDLGFDQITAGGRNYYRVSRPPYLTRAVVVVNGQELYEWTTVEVHLEIGNNPTRRFRFTVSEQEDLTTTGMGVSTSDPNSAFRIRPPDKCTIFLDGYMVINGWVSTRQVFYDKDQHAVELQGMGWAGRDGQGAAVSQTHEFKDKDIMQIAQAVEQNLGVKVMDANASKEKIPRASITPGETAFEFIEKLARGVGTKIDENEMGDRVLTDGMPIGSGELVEGYNIVEGREIIHSTQGSQGNQITGTAPGGDQADYAKANQMHSSANMSGQGVQPGMGVRSLMEIPFFSDMFGKMRANHETTVADNLMIQVTCKVNGWSKEGGGLWQPRDRVWVSSPMLIMDRVLIVKAVTFRQSSEGGTTTDILLVNKLSDKEQASGG